MMTPEWHNANEVIPSVTLRKTRRLTIIGTVRPLMWSSDVKLRQRTATERQKEDDPS